MKGNYESCLLGEKVVLFPYRPEHVPRYHEWMKDPELLEATGSEPLSLREEIEMQQSWRDDPKKCTFIVHSSSSSSRSVIEISNDDDDCDDEKNNSNNSSNYGGCAIKKQQQQFLNVVDNLNSMVGDVNLFLSDMEENDDDNIIDDEDEEEENCCVSNNNSDEKQKQQQQAEIDIMIAESDFKRKGLGREATSIMLCYGATIIPNLKRYFCKINDDNLASIKLFKSIGFVQCDYVECFKQVELELKVTSKEELIKILQPYGGHYKIIPCPL